MFLGIFLTLKSQLSQTDDPDLTSLNGVFTIHIPISE